MTNAEALRAELAHLFVHTDELAADRIRKMADALIEENKAYLAQRAVMLREANAAIADALLVWSFSDGQQHTHSWHDREDWKERHWPAIERARVTQ